jgi:hypothetical protein
LSFDVADNRTIFYTMHASRVERAKSDLTAQIKRIEETGYKPRNPILDAIGLISLERSAEPTQQAIAALAREVASLRGDVGDIRSSLREPLQTVPGHLLGLDEVPPPGQSNRTDKSRLLAVLGISESEYVTRFTSPAQTDWVMRCTAKKVLRTAEQEPVVLPPAKAPTLPPSWRVRAPARERRPEIKGRGRPTRSSGGRSIG